MERILMQEALDRAWASEDAEARRLQDRLFPRGKSTPELFVAKIAAFVASAMNENIPDE